MSFLDVRNKSLLFSYLEEYRDKKLLKSSCTYYDLLNRLIKEDFTEDSCLTTIENLIKILNENHLSGGNILLNDYLYSFIHKHNLKIIDRNENIIKIDQFEEGISINWRIKILDEHNGWFNAYAIKYFDSIQSLEVIVEETKSFIVRLDPRLIKLLNCYDKETITFFNFLRLKDYININWKILIRVNTNGNQTIWREATANHFFPYINCLSYRDNESEEIVYIKGNKVKLIFNNDFFTNIYSYKWFEFLYKDNIMISTQAKMQLESFKIFYSNNILSIDYEGPSKSSNEEINTNEQSSVCVICMNNPPTNVVFIPCGHQCACSKCFQTYFQNDEIDFDHLDNTNMIQTCPICRIKIEDFLTYYSL